MNNPIPSVEATSLDLTILIPCKNEEANVVGAINTVVSALNELGCSYEIIVVDDGSTDRTSGLVAEFQSKRPDLPVRLRRNPLNLGLSRTFVDTAFAAKGRYYRLVCGDDVEPRETVIEILKHMGKAELVIPYHQDAPGSLLRIFISRTYTHLVNLFSGYSLHYYNGGPLFLRDHVLRWHSYAFGFGFQADLLTRLLDEGATFVEVPISASRREKGGPASYMNPRNFVSTSHTLYEILRRRLNRMVFKDKQ